VLWVSTPGAHTLTIHTTRTNRYPLCSMTMTDTYRLTVAVRKRSNLDAPANTDEAVALVKDLLAQGSLIDVLSVLPEQENKGSQVRWG
jgi:hypothetical protein